MQRPSFIDVWLRVASVISTRSTCPRLRVGAVVVNKENQIIATGYNGAPRKKPHCDEVGCVMEHNHCINAVHAEVNALLAAGPAARGGSIYVTHKPCKRCANIITAAGIVDVHYSKEYP